MSVVKDSIQSLVEKLSLEEKVSLLAGADIWHTQEIPRLGIGAIKTTDGPSGARGKYAVDGPTAAFVPGPVCQAATWSKAQMLELGRLLCREARTKSSHVLLAPTICIARNPLGGRNFECFGEDPFLSGSLAVEYVKGVQETGEVAATPKHFVANEQEYQRFSIDARISEKALREIYLRPFEMVFRGPSPADCVMTSYNQLNGSHADMSSWLVRDVLRKDWGFSGLVMSDWGGTNSTTQSLLAGLDLEMPGPPEQRGKKLLDVAKEGDRDVLSAIDVSVSRILTLAEKHGLTGLTPEQATATRDSRETSSTTSMDVQLMRDLAANGIVLLKNSANTLPLRSENLKGRQVAFIGPNALHGTPGGGGSASMNPQYLSQPLDSFRAVTSQAGIDVSVKYCLGAVGRKWLPLCSGSQWKVPSSESGLASETNGKDLVRVEYFAHRDLSGPVVETQYRGSLNLDMSDSAPREFQTDPVPPYSYRASSVATPESSGTHRFSISSVGDARLYVDGELIIDNTSWKRSGETFYAFGSAEAIGEKLMTAGREYTVTIEGNVRKDPRPDDGGMPADANHVFAAHPSVRVGFEEEMPSPEKLIQEAIEAADESEITVVVIGLSDEWESEGYDRQDMTLPGHQNQLVEALLSKVKRPESLVFVNQSGSPVELPWVDRASTVLQAWYGGQEAGNALADVLLGTINPSGRLPITWPRRYADLPFASAPDTWPGTDGKVYYSEETQVGYRWFKHNSSVAPQWWFGYGQSYTNFRTSIKGVNTRAQSWTIEVSVTNTGQLAGAEVVQLYVWPTGEPEEVMLVAFEKTSVVERGETVNVSLEVSHREVARWIDGSWQLQSGNYTFGAGNGVGDTNMSVRSIEVLGTTA